ncbi:MAG: small ribosomal subunit protein bS21 [Patescibacteria group bacterium]
MTKVIRRDNENVESLLRRFIRNVQQSKVITNAKERQRRVRPVKRKFKRIVAIQKAARLKRRLLK